MPGTVVAMPKDKSELSDQMPSWREVFLYFLFLGFVNVGGPVAQITMMYNHMVERRKWLSKDRFVKIMAFCHMLPGPEALQLAIYVTHNEDEAATLATRIALMTDGRIELMDKAERLKLNRSKGAMSSVERNYEAV